jgi:hypothetical protein
MSDQPSPRRRFQFRLRTLMIVVTLMAAACGYVAHEARIAKERREAAEIYEPLRESVRKVWGGRLEYSSRTVLVEAPWPLRWFGEDGYKAILVPYNTPADEIVRLEGLFPEASVVRKSASD